MNCKGKNFQGKYENPLKIPGLLTLPNPPGSKVNTWCSFESWTIYDSDQSARPPNRVSHEMGQEQMRIFATKLQDVEES